MVALVVAARVSMHMRTYRGVKIARDSPARTPMSIHQVGLLPVV